MRENVNEGGCVGVVIEVKRLRRVNGRFVDFNLGLPFLLLPPLPSSCS